MSKVLGGARSRPWWWNFRIFMKNRDFAEIPWGAPRAKRIDFRRVLSIKIAGGPALRAMFKISAISRAAVMHGDFHGDAGGASFLNSCSRIFFIWIWLVETAFPKRSCLKQYFSNTGAKSWSIMAGNYLGVWNGFLSCAPNSDSRFQFPFVQYHSFIWGFKFWARELPENFR